MAISLAGRSSRRENERWALRLLEICWDLLRSIIFIINNFRYPFEIEHFSFLPIPFPSHNFPLPAYLFVVFEVSCLWEWGVYLMSKWNYLDINLMGIRWKWSWYTGWLGRHEDDLLVGDHLPLTFIILCILYCNWLFFILLYFNTLLHPCSILHFHYFNSYSLGSYIHFVCDWWILLCLSFFWKQCCYDCHNYHVDPAFAHKWISAFHNLQKSLFITWLSYGRQMQH